VRLFCSLAMDRVSEYLSQWLRRKEINFSKNEKLQRTLTWVDLIGIGVGCVVGAGIFVLTGIAAAEAAGPAISISFAFDFIACVLSALCYTEVAARHPVRICRGAYSRTRRECALRLTPVLADCWIGVHLCLHLGRRVPSLLGWLVDMCCSTRTCRSLSRALSLRSPNSYQWFERG